MFVITISGGKVIICSDRWSLSTFHVMSFRRAIPIALVGNNFVYGTTFEHLVLQILLQLYLDQIVKYSQQFRIIVH